jgi:hypothetical protein
MIWALAGDEPLAGLCVSGGEADFSTSPLFLSPACLGKLLLGSFIRADISFASNTMAAQAPQPCAEGVGLSGAMARPSGGLHHENSRRIPDDTGTRAHAARYCACQLTHK